jgi:hypothetical protein
MPERVSSKYDVLDALRRFPRLTNKQKSTLQKARRQNSRTSKAQKRKRSPPSSTPIPLNTLEIHTSKDEVDG